MPGSGIQAPNRTRVPALVVFAVFLKLGLTSFGGPLAHIGYFRNEFVERRGWLTEAGFAELVALCHFLPGPASSQAGFAIGLDKAGIAGGIAAFLGFTLPSAILMLAAAFGLAFLSGPILPPIVHGLNLVAVAIVAQAVVLMARANLRSLTAVALAMLSLAAVLSGNAYSAPAAIAIAALAGLIVPPAGPPAAQPVRPEKPARLFWPLALFGLFLGLLVVLPALRQLTSDPILATADGFYRTGALVFGGGHVILPLIEAETMANVSHADFLAGYGAAQALPGPLSAFAAYAGALNSPNPPDLFLGLVALGAIFLPGFLLVGAAAPVWTRLRATPRVARLVAFAGAAVVGVLAAAWWSPIAVTVIQSPIDAVIASAGFALLMIPRMPVLAVVALVAASGATVHALL